MKKLFMRFFTALMVASFVFLSIPIVVYASEGYICNIILNQQIERESARLQRYRNEAVRSMNARGVVTFDIAPMMANLGPLMGVVHNIRTRASDFENNGFIPNFDNVAEFQTGVFLATARGQVNTRILLPNQVQAVPHGTVGFINEAIVSSGSSSSWSGFTIAAQANSGWVNLSNNSATFTSAVSAQRRPDDN
ncbi:MAG: hypothetical protein FWC16_00340 [Defluviitaleaceae bacterium]|nr:hypothetical protein [Defluviitaleaceae bacterium]MCL2273351.1 hypothetical protein [Defluviitaleaceae bacterium]